MAGDTKDIELRIRARDYSQKTLNEVVGTLKSLSTAQDEQVASAKRGETSAKSLEDSYRKLEAVAKSLLSQNAAIQTFTRQSEVLTEVKAKVDAAREAQAAYAQTLGATGTHTAKQAAELAKLAKAVERAEGAQIKAENSVAKTAARLSEYGIATDKVVQAQTRIRDAFAQTNQALEKHDNAISNLDADTRAYKSAQASAEQYAKAVRSVQDSQVNGMWQGLLQERDAKEKQAAEAALQRAASQKAADDQAVLSAKQAIALAHTQAIAEDKSRTAATQDAEARQVQRAALNRAASEAEGLAKGYDTLARSVKNVRADVLTNQIKGIADPAGEAIKTTQGLADAMDKLDAKTKEINGPVKEYSASLKELTAIQKSLQTVAGQVDGYQRQMQAVRAARTEYSQAREAVRTLAAQMRSGGGDTATLTAAMVKAQATLRTTAENTRRTTQAAHEMRTALRAAGVDTRNLAEAEQVLIGVATRATTATQRLTDAYSKHGAAAQSADSKLRAWVSGERTTLSFFQRLRGEVLALTTAYIGVQAAMTLAKDSLGAYRSAQAIESRLGVMVGNDATLIKKEWDYLMGQSNRLGFSFEELAMSYSKFGIAAKTTGMTTDETRFIFEKLAEAARVARMDTMAFEGSMKAIEQMLSKGKITAEELRQQLGDHLPGAMALAAKGAGKTVAEFSKLMEMGDISSDFVINMAREMNKQYGSGGQLETATDSMVAAEARLQTAIFNFKLAIANKGFVDAYVDFITKLTAVLSSPQGQQLAQSLSNGFSAVVEILKWTAENIDTVAMALSALLGLQIFRWLASATQGIGAMAGALAGLRAGLLTTGLAVGTTGTVVGSMAAAMGIGATSVGTLTKGVNLLAFALRSLVRLIPYIGMAWMAYEAYSALKPPPEMAGPPKPPVGATPDPGTGGDPSEFVASAIDKELARLTTSTEKADRRTRMKGAKGELQERLDIAGELYDGLAMQANEHIKDETKRAEKLASIEKAKNAALSVETLKFQQDQARSAGAGGANRISMAVKVADELKKIEDDLAKRETGQDPTASFEDRMRTRVAAIAHEYDKLGQRIDKLSKTNPTMGADAKVQLAGFIQQRQEIEKVKVTTEELKRLEDAVNKEVALRSTLIARVNAQHQVGLITYEETKTQIEEINVAAGQAIGTAGAALESFATTMKDLMKPADYQVLLARIQTVMATSDSKFLSLKGSLEGTEAHINNLMGQRSAIMATLQGQRELGIITDAAATDDMNAAHAEFRQSIIAATDEAILLAEALRTPATSGDIDILIAKYATLRGQMQQGTVVAGNMATTFTNSFVTNGMTAIDGMAQSMANLITKQQESGDMWAAVGQASAQFFSQLLRDIAMAIIKQQILTALSSMSGGGGIWGQIGTAAAGAATKHAGGVIGRGTGTRNRTVSPFVFAGAERFHSGGLPGLNTDEVPAILQKGEEVLDRDNPRNILNGGAAKGGGGGSSNRFVLVDDRAKMAEAMAGAEGEEVTMVHLRRNIATIKQMVK